MLDSIFINGIDVSNALLGVGCAIVYGFLIAIFHKSTSKYNKNFLITLSCLPLIIMSIILLVNGNLGMGVAVAGTFSLIRFRSLPGTSREMLSIFLAMAVGLAVGSGYVAFAGILTLTACVLMKFFSTINVFESKKYERLLKVQMPEDLDYSNVFDEVLKKYTLKYELESVKTVNLGSMFELKYRVVIDKNVNEKEFIDDLRIRNGNLKIVLSSELGNDSEL